MTAVEILARHLYHAHPIIYRSWNTADVSVRRVYENQARQVIDSLADSGFRIVPDSEGGQS